MLKNLVFLKLNKIAKALNPPENFEHDIECYAQKNV